MIITSVCRLCMSEKDLRCVFDEGNNSVSDMKRIISITTGVEISQNDIISQKICSNCFKLTGKMFEFRERAAKTDKYLKDQCKNVIQQNGIQDNAQPPVITIKKDIPESVSPVDKVPSVSAAIVHEIKKSIEIEKIKAETTSTDTSKKAKKRIHKSIEQIFVAHSDIKLPSACLRLDVDPSVSLEIDYVESYFRRNNLDMKKYVQQALRSNRASKKTTTKQKKTIKVEASSIEKNERTVDEKKHGTIQRPNEIKVSPSSIKLPKVLPQQNDDEDNEDTIIKSFLPRKRRRISDSSTEAITKPTLMQTLQFKSNEKVFVHRCPICNSPKLNAKALKQHYQTHFKCTYCKKIFKISDRKEAHDKICEIKYCLTRPLYVKLEKIDITKYLKNLSEYIKTGENEYQESVKDEFQGTATKTLVPNKVFEDKKTEESGIKVNAEENSVKDEIIELFDNETDPSTSSIVACTSKSTDLPIPLQVPLSNHLPNLIRLPLNTNNTNMPLPEKSYCTGTSIVRPTIHIEDNCVLNSIDTSEADLKVLKQLLSPKNSKVLVEDGTQTIIPNQIRYTNNFAEFKNLLPQLHFSKIPIEAKIGNFKVSYDKKKQMQKNKKGLAHWRYAKPLDVKCTNDQFFCTKNLDTHILQGIPLFSKKKENLPGPTVFSKAKINSSQPTILNHTLPQFIQTNAAPQSFQYLAVINPPRQTQTSQTQNFNSSNVQVYNLPQAQNQPSAVQVHSVPQQVQTSSNQTHNLFQRDQTQTRNIQKHILPQKVTTQTSNIKTHKLPQQVQNSISFKTVSLKSQIQSKLQSVTMPHKIPTTTVQSHVLPQTYFVSQQRPTNTIPINSSTIVQNLPNYFVQANNTVMSTASPQIVIPVTSSTSLNTTITSNNQVSTNTNENTLSGIHIQSNTNSQKSTNVLSTNYSSAILNPVSTQTAETSNTNNQQNINPNSTILNAPVSIRSAPITTSTTNTSSHYLLANNQTSTASKLVVNSSYVYPSSASKTPPPNVNIFNYTVASTISGANSVVNTNAQLSRTSNINNIENNSDLHRPIIKVRNICDLI